MPIIDTGKTFEIYSVGDGLLMRRVIDSVAAMSNAGLLLELLALSLLIGLLVMAFRNVIAGGNKLDLGTTLVAFILGSAMFGMRADVVIHDMNFAPGEVDQPSYTVANVPYGLAATGSLISNIGYTLTLKMEQGYGLWSGGRSTLIEGGFGNTLQWINELRAWEKPTFGDGGTGPASLLRKNMMSYMSECVAPGIRMDHLSLEQILHSPNIWSMGSPAAGGIGYNSQWLTTSYTTPTGQVISHTCADAFDLLDSDRADVFPAFADALAKTKLDQSTGGTDVASAMNEAFQTIGINQTRMQDLVVAELAGMTLEAALNGVDSSVLNAQSKLMVEQAQMQRAVQWAAEETLFRRVMRPMMAFFESLMYALAPFMALAMGLGPFGIALVGQYLKFSIWVVAWLPVLSIIELFQVTMMQHAVNAMTNGLDMTGGGGVTIAAAQALRNDSIQWLSAGAALASWTPVLTMALIWGGSVMASHIGQAMRGSDHVNEKVVAPDTVSTTPAVSAGSRYEYSHAGGGHMGGAAGAVPSINVSQASSSMLSSAERYVESARAEVSAAMADEARVASSMTNSVTAGTQNSRTGTTSAADVGNAMRTSATTEAQSKTHSNSTATSDSHSVKQDASANLGVSAAGTGVGVGAGAGTQQTNTTGRSHGQSTATGVAETAQVASGHQFRSAQEASESTSLGATTQASSQKSVAKSERLARAEANLAQAEASYAKQAQFAAEHGMKQNVPISALAQTALRTGSASNFDALVAEAGVGHKVAGFQSQMVALGMAADQAKAAAQIAALHEGAMEGAGGKTNAAQASRAQSAFTAAMEGNLLAGEAYAGGVRMQPGTNAGLVDSVGGRVPERGDMEQRTRGVSGPGFSSGALLGAVGGALSGDQGTLGSMQASSQRSVGANPGGYGTFSADAGRAAAVSAEGAGVPMMEEVSRHGAGNMADATTGFYAQSHNTWMDFTTDSPAEQMKSALALAPSMPEGHAGEGHLLSRMAEDTLQKYPFLASTTAGSGRAAANLIATMEMLDSGKPAEVPRGNLVDAYRYATTDEGRAVLNSYVDKTKGEAGLVESQAKHDSGRAGWAGLPNHMQLMDRPTTSDGLPAGSVAPPQSTPEQQEARRQANNEWFKNNPSGLKSNDD